MPEISVFFDRGHDPARNLAREDELFRSIQEKGSTEMLRFWVNSTCLVRGLRRSPKYGWYKGDVARELGVPVFERSTGGGVVYHDEGNLNWSFFLKNSGRLLSPAQMFEDVSRHLIRALGRLGVTARFAPPNRIDVDGRKVSGLAARSTPKARLVHGTLLLDADLEKLNRLCIPPPGCPPVANISRWAKGVEAADVVRALVEALKESGFAVVS
jgi:lipoate---protein ligase